MKEDKKTDIFKSLFQKIKDIQLVIQKLLVFEYLFLKVDRKHSIILILPKTKKKVWKSWVYLDRLMSKKPEMSPEK